MSHCLIVSVAPAAELPAPARAFIDQHCAECHDADAKKGGLDLTSLAYDPNNRDSVAKWIRIHDRVEHGEMPPKKRERPEVNDLKGFLGQLHQQLETDDLARIASMGRSPRRRLNAYEYENALRDLLGIPWLEVKSKFPSDGVVHGYNKLSDALNFSHVQMGRYLAMAEEAISLVLAENLQARPKSQTTRYHSRDVEGMTRHFTRYFGKTNGSKGPLAITSVDRQTFPVLDGHGQPEVRFQKAPLSVGENDPAVREREAVGQFGSMYDGFLAIWDVKIPVAGFYRLRVNGYTIWAATGGTLTKQGNRPNPHEADADVLSFGRRNEPITIIANQGKRGRRATNAGFDLTPAPTTHEVGPVWFQKNDNLVIDPVRFFHSWPDDWVNPLNTKEGVPGVAFSWIEVEGPLSEFDTTRTGYRGLFDEMPLIQVPASAPGYTLAGKPGRLRVSVGSENPARDAERLMRSFLNRAWRRPASENEVQSFTAFVTQRMQAGLDFTQAMVVGYVAVLCSSSFLEVEEQPGALDDDALATRLSLFIWNSPPDHTLRELALKGELHKPEVLRTQTERLMNDEKSERFVEAFLDYWLDLRRYDESAPSETLYADYHTDDWLTSSALQESRLYFADLIRRDLPVRNIVNSDYTFLNERLARHYDIPGVEGFAMRRVTLPAGSPRGGLMTQAAVLKVTANGTTTSPVVRGKWINERIMGVEIPPPPASVPAVEPDIRGATTLRAQLAKHRSDASCASCHVKIDPPGFALESFDVMGAWREKYRAVSEDSTPAPGRGFNGHRFVFHHGPLVDATGQFPDGTPFKDIHEFKQHLIKQEAALARNMTRQLLTYATGAPVSFSDRAKVEQIVQASASQQYGLRTLIHGIVQSELFRNK